MIITIDGPAGVGKSTVARALARRLGFRFIDTGATYRAVTLAGMRRGIDWDRPEQLAQLAATLDIQMVGPRVFLDGEDVGEALRGSAVTAASRHAAANPAIREQLVGLQRKLVGNDDAVTEGRDQGTIVFPNAQCKIFLTASPEERARRRLRDLQAQSESATLEEVLAAQERRDRRDSSREVGPLAAADDAIEVCTDAMTLEEVVDHLEALFKASTPRIAARGRLPADN